MGKDAGFAPGKVPPWLAVSPLFVKRVPSCHSLLVPKQTRIGSWDSANDGYCGVAQFPKQLYIPCCPDIEQSATFVFAPNSLKNNLSMNAPPIPNYPEQHDQL
ncbi:unnamed protein product [Aspergillus oryzae var. brunneus]|uniref:Unnamed protein product n=2 Tax=Aspergillus oryzae TaxID=5062 RepID=A0AAN5C3M1_ASPOZ|nr:unnamed protein product [Aspergillus oryzae]GMG38600.1 unnamed protein product [Aspergillus oryzae]GMG48527.1 unnamed protein product [Aspergillus oryzae var. brunneus]